MTSQKTQLDQQIASQIAELFATLGDASRVRIIAALVMSEHNVSSISEIVEISPSAVSHHMRVLRQMRFVRANKKGREVFWQKSIC